MGVYHESLIKISPAVVEKRPWGGDGEASHGEASPWGASPSKINFCSFCTIKLIRWC